jgi:hypothetical protein
MNRIEKRHSGAGRHEPPAYPGRDLPPPPIDEPPGELEPDQPPMRDPPLRPEGDPAKIARPAG